MKICLSNKEEMIIKWVVIIDFVNFTKSIFAIFQQIYMLFNDLSWLDLSDFCLIAFAY